MATNKIVNKLPLILIKKVGIKILVLGKLFKTTVVSMTTTSYDQLKFLNLVTMADQHPD